MFQAGAVTSGLEGHGKPLPYHPQIPPTPGYLNAVWPAQNRPKPQFVFEFPILCLTQVRLKQYGPLSRPLPRPMRPPPIGATPVCRPVKSGAILCLLRGRRGPESPYNILWNEHIFRAFPGPFPGLSRAFPPFPDLSRTFPGPFPDFV